MIVAPQLDQEQQSIWSYAGNECKDEQEDGIVDVAVLQVLVVPRRQPLRPKARPLERVLNEEEQLPTPQTPERSTSSASTFSSPHSSVFSPHHLSRPYAQVPPTTPVSPTSMLLLNACNLEALETALLHAV